MKTFSGLYSGLLRVKRSVFLCFLVVHVFQPAFSQRSWYVNFTPGFSFTPPSPIIIKQDGFENISFWAEFKTEPLKMPLYYSYRLGFENDKRMWELEMNHLKVYLKNLTSEVSRFNISHGFNQVFLNMRISTKKISQKLGAGIVVAHPENTIRGISLDEKKGLSGIGYYLAGPAVQYALFNEIAVTDFFYLLIEGKCSIGYANVPVAGGRAHALVYAVHFQIGPGFKIKEGTP